MAKSLLGAAAAAAILAAGVAFAQTAQPAQPGQPAPRAHVMKTETRADVQAHVARMFARFDANRDGLITRDEVATAKPQSGKRQQRRDRGFDRSKAFDRMDTNHDGVISREEFAAAPKPKRFGARMAGMNRGFGGRMFETADLNKDGRVSLAEAQQAALQHFDRADLNRDGTLTPDERRQARELLRGQRRPS